MNEQAIARTAQTICQHLDGMPADVMLQSLIAVIVSTCLTYDKPEQAALAISLTVSAALGTHRCRLATMPVAGSC